MDGWYLGGSVGGGGVCRRLMVCSVDRLLREYLSASLIEVSLRVGGGSVPARPTIASTVSAGDAARTQTAGWAGA